MAQTAKHKTANDAPVAGIHIASMVRGSESEVNARLITAAPELLFALKGVLSLAHEHDEHEELDAARAAISKAESTS